MHVPSLIAGFIAGALCVGVVVVVHRIGKRVDFDILNRQLRAPDPRGFKPDSATQFREDMRRAQSNGRYH